MGASEQARGAVQSSLLRALGSENPNQTGKMI